MKINCLRLLRLFAFGNAFLLIQVSSAQDTLIVPWETSPGSGIPQIDALTYAISSDTIQGGARANTNRVYKLMKGGIYWISHGIENKRFPLRIVGEPAGAAHQDCPPLLQMHHDGSYLDTKMITGMTDVTLKNLFISGRDDVGSQNFSYQKITMSAENSTFIIDNCVFEQDNFATVAFTGSGNTISITNCKFRNLIENPITLQWTGRGISIWADQESVVVENNTFFNVGCFGVQIEGGSTRYYRFNHNTIVNCGRQIAQGNWYQKAFLVNNLIINGFWQGEGYCDMFATGRDARKTYNGLFTIGALPSSYGPEEGRAIYIGKSAAYLDPAIIALYGDTIVRPRWVDPITQADFLNIYQDNMKSADTVWLSQNPIRDHYPLTDDAWLQPAYSVTAATMLDSMWASITQIRASITPAAQYVYKPTIAATDYTWPLPENFSYTDDLSAISTDSLPLGDLNWFPSQKASWEANKETHIKNIHALLKKDPPPSFSSKYEADEGALGGTAKIDTTKGLTYYVLTASGYIRWTANITTAGEYDMRFWIHERGRGLSGPILRINNHEIHDKAHMWGQFIFDAYAGITCGMPNDEWIWTMVTADSVGGANEFSNDSSYFTLAAGVNTVEWLANWGEMGFAGIDLIRRTTVDTIKLRAPDAEVLNVIPGSKDIAWTPTGFEYVSLGTMGTITWNINIETAGYCLFRTFYQNSAAPQEIQIKEGTTVLATEYFEAKPDSTECENYSHGFYLTEGIHSITLSGSGINIDYINVYTYWPGVDEKDVLIPDEITLNQNYPNPFNPTTEIGFSVGRSSNIRLAVNNLLGQEVAVLVHGNMESGHHTVKFDASRLSSGVYFYCLKAGNNVLQKKMLLLK